jgi:pseudouridine-5'-phosphate glycosidase
MNESHSAPIPSAEEIAAMREVCEAARDAATSLEAIAKLAGRDEFMIDVEDTRGYAANRAKVAREALQRLAAARAKGGAT